MSTSEESLVSVYSTNNLALIAVIKSLLDNAAIEYVAKNDALSGIWPYFSFTRVDFLVKPEDEAEAKELLQSVRQSSSGPFYPPEENTGSSS